MNTVTRDATDRKSKLSRVNNKLSVVYSGTVLRPAVSSGAGANPHDHILSTASSVDFSVSAGQKGGQATSTYLLSDSKENIPALRTVNRELQHTASGSSHTKSSSNSEVSSNKHTSAVRRSTNSLRASTDSLASAATSGSTADLAAVPEPVNAEIDARIKALHAYLEQSR